MKKNYDRSIAECDKAIDVDPKFAMAYNTCCSAYNDKKDYDRAMAYCNKAIELDPKNDVAYDNRCLEPCHRRATAASISRL